MWESCKIEKKECFPEREAEQECNKEEVHSKMEGSENFVQINGISSTENIDEVEANHQSSSNIRRRSLCTAQKFWTPTQEGYLQP